MSDPKDSDESPGAPSSSPSSTGTTGGTPSSPPATTSAPSTSSIPVPVSSTGGVIYASLPMHMYPYAPLPHEPLRSKRRQVKNACTNCQKACKKCDDARPCLRCVKYGVADECVDSQRKERKKGVKRGPYKKRDDRGKESDPALHPPSSSTSLSSNSLSSAPPPLGMGVGMQHPQVPMQVPYYQPPPGYYQPFVPHPSHPSLPPHPHASLQQGHPNQQGQGKEGGGGGTGVVPYYLPLPLPHQQQQMMEMQQQQQQGQGGQIQQGGVYYPYATPYVPYPPYVAHDGTVVGVGHFPIYSVAPHQGQGQQVVGGGQGVVQAGAQEGEGEE